MGFENRIAVVTGAGSGVGRAVAEGLLAEGRTVVLVGRRPGPLQAVAERSPDRAVVHAADLGVTPAPAAIAATAIEAATHRGGVVDVLVNNAGLAELAPLAETDDPMLMRSLEVNLLGPVRLLRSLWGALVDSGAGRIVHVSSMATLDPFPGFLAYAAAKSALESAARSAAIEGAEHGIKAWSVAPGAIETPMLRGLFDESVVPASATLDPADVAAVALACVRDERTESPGSVIRLPGPAA